MENKKKFTEQCSKEITRRMCYLLTNARNERRTQNKKCVNCIVNLMGTFKT